MNIPIGQLISAIVMIVVALGLIYAFWRYLNELTAEYRRGDAPR